MYAQANRLHDRRRWKAAGWLLVFLLFCPPSLTGFGGADRLGDELRKARQLMAAGQLEEARDLLDRVSPSFGSDPRLHNFLGVLAAQMGDYENAEGEFLKSIDLDPSFRDPYGNLERLYLENTGKDDTALDKGVEIYRRMLLYFPGDVEANYRAALLLNMKGSYRESMVHLARLPKEIVAQPRPMLLACANYAGLGNKARADQIADSLLELNAVSEEDLLVLLPSIRKSDRDDLAIRFLQSLFDHQKLSRESAEGLAFLYLENDQPDPALQTLESLAGEEEDLFDLLVKMAWVAYRGKQYERTLSYLAHARDLNPNDARIHLFFGLTCVELGLGVEALRSLEQALSLDPENPYYNYVFGVVVMHWREVAEAIPYLEKYCRLRPSDPQGKAALAKAHFLNKEYDLSQSEFEPLVAFEKTALEANYYLGVMARINRRFDEAMKYLQTALRLRPDNPDALAELGAVYTRLRRFPEASEVLQHALTLQPNHYQANFNLLTLYSRMRDPRYEQQKQAFEEIKEERWQKLTDSLRTIEVVPHYVFPGSLGGLVPNPQDK